MNKMTRVENPAVPAVTEQPPVAIWGLGRQRVGKTTFLTALLDTVRARGGTPEIWNADIQNQSSSLSVYYPEALVPRQRIQGEQRRWLEERIQAQLMHRQDAVLDIGGGATALQEVVDDGPIAELLASQGIRLTVVYVVGPDPADLDYLEDMQRRGLLLPDRSLIVLNGGLVPRGYDAGITFEPVFRHPVVAAALATGATAIVMPALSCMDEVVRQELSFTRYLDPASTGKHPPITPWNRMKVRKWVEQDFPASLRSIPPGWLPRLGAGETY